MNSKLNPDEMEQVKGVREALDPGSTMRFTARVESVDKDGNIKHEEHTVDGKPLTVLVHQGGMEVSLLDDDIATITAEDTVAMATNTPQAEWDEVRKLDRFLALYNKVFDGAAPPVVLKSAPLDVRHIVGMIFLIAKALSEGKRPFIKLPETYLHPKQQAQLASMLVDMQKGDTR